jgi:hypothetical protein
MRLNVGNHGATKNRTHQHALTNYGQIKVQK